jgi:hypothetical protein
MVSVSAKKYKKIHACVPLKDLKKYSSRGTIPLKDILLSLCHRYRVGQSVQLNPQSEEEKNN